MPQEEKQRKHTTAATSSNNAVMQQQPSEKKSNEKRSSSTEESTESQFKKLPQEQLTMDDYFRKNQEFKLWLLQHKKKRVEDDLQDTDEIQKYFKKFVKKWNRGELSSKYYSGIHSSELSHQQRTSYKWNFKNVSNDEEMKLELTRDKVDTNTYEKTWSQEEGGEKKNTNSRKTRE